MKSYIAVDIGASSGRLMLGQQKRGQLTLKEVHRFSNGFAMKDVELGIDTWAVDYVLVGENGHKLEDPISYRDKRTHNAIQQLTSDLPKEYIYEKTGIQFQDFNTLYQLYKENHDLLAKTDKIMMMPDYLGYVLTGNAVTEITNASTTQMLNLRVGLFDKDLLGKVNVSQDQFPRLVESGSVLGNVSHKWHTQYDIPEVEVVTVATHDTASAVVGTPGEGDRWAFLSSGTWSLLGTELNVPENGLQAFHENYTNEWGAYGTYRFLKNIMGLWVAQCVRHELGDQYSFGELADLAQQVRPFQQFIDINDERFTNPENMIKELQDYCRETKQTIPETPGELFQAIYSNLSLFYANELNKLDRILGYHIDTLNIVGGGSNVALMNQLTSTLANIKVVAGPSEATAVGNIMVQMITSDEVENIGAGRRLIETSFDLKRYLPETNKYGDILKEYQRFLTNKSKEMV